jgi:hypothetical protein
MQLIGRLNPIQIRNRLLMVTLGLGIFSIVTEYLVEVVLVLSSDQVLIDVLNLFSVNLEESIPTWYATILLFVVAVLLVFIGLAKFREGDVYRWHWAVLAIGFLYLSIDEGAGIHEIFVDPMKQAFDPSGFFAFGWQIAAIPVVLIIAVLYLRFIMQLPTRTRIGLMVSASLYLGGALIVEGISASLYNDDNISMLYLSVATIEELFEMSGVVLFIYTLLDMMEQSGYSFALHHVPTASTSQKTHDGYNIPPILPVLFILNVILLSWMMLIPQPEMLSDEEEIVIAPFYYMVQDQILGDDGVIVEMNGIFGIDNPFSRQMGSTLLQDYKFVVAVAQPTSHITTLIATRTVFISRQNLTDLLHNIGQTNFIIFETDTVKAISQLE